MSLVSADHYYIRCYICGQYWCSIMRGFRFTGENTFVRTRYPCELSADLPRILLLRD